MHFSSLQLVDIFFSTTYDALDEGQLTKKRSNIVNNSNLLKLATGTIYSFLVINIAAKNYTWSKLKAMVDKNVVEALVGACIIDSGFKAATAFLNWLGMDFTRSQIDNISALLCSASKAFLPLADQMDVNALENLGYIQVCPGFSSGLCSSIFQQSFGRLLPGIYALMSKFNQL
ncbi:UNVERIFIED_CONTAM: Dicer-like protein 4 [Sesamum calycinum]|uniref:Dicer-like protein 4 n=1 Tax=Sesamum calycinum TaxID=2727403 RepID=A0AAW2JUG0_9LAMI